MNNQNSNASAAANEYASRAQKLPEAVQYAILTALPNCANGAFWGFTSMEEASRHIDVIKGNQNILAHKIANACLVEVNPDYLYKACHVIDPALMPEQVVRSMQKDLAEAMAAFEKFLYVKAEKEPKKSQLVGIYCVNDSTAITYKGISYPAFRVNLSNALQLLAKWGYVVNVKGKAVTPAAAANAGQAVYDSMTLSPTNTGVFIQICPTYSPEQIKQFKVQFGISKK